MNISHIISEVLSWVGREWSTTNGPVQPLEEHIDNFLDEAVSHLYSSPVGTRFTGGGIIIEKMSNKIYEAYVYVGTYS